MLKKLETIVAIATPNGTGSIGVIRLSGQLSIKIADSIFKGKKLIEQNSHTVHFGKIINNQNEVIDEVVVSIFLAPHSYTGENVIEISCHGSPYIIQTILALCIAQGAQLARAGEFTQRAFLNGKMDLTQAESVADLIASNNQAQQKAALHNLRGGFKNDLFQMREQLIEFAALLELELDFAEEDVAFADHQKFHQLVEKLQTYTERLIQSFQLGNAVKSGIKVAIIGKPNAGKSTLLNTLLNEERAIVSNIAGTTRDAIEEVLMINGIAFKMIDTAGIRQQTNDEIETIGIKKSIEKIEEADFIIFLIDASKHNWEADLKELTSIAIDKPNLICVNKIDLNIQHIDQPDFLYISAKNKTGIEELKIKIYETFIKEEINFENTIITNTRHLEQLQKIIQSLKDIKINLKNNLSNDFITPDIRLCLHYIGELTGTITNENVLDYVFSRFCIGK